MMDPRTFQSLHVSRVSMITQGGVCNASTIQTFCRTRDGWSNCFYNVINAVFNCFPTMDVSILAWFDSQLVSGKCLAAGKREVLFH